MGLHINSPIEQNTRNNMGIMAPQIETAQALKTIANEATRPWYKKAEFWIGIVANMIALGALMVAIVALQTQ